MSVLRWWTRGIIRRISIWRPALRAEGEAFKYIQICMYLNVSRVSSIRSTVKVKKAASNYNCSWSSFLCSDMKSWKILVLGDGLHGCFPIDVHCVEDNLYFLYPLTPSQVPQPTCDWTFIAVGEPDYLTLYIPPYTVRHPSFGELEPTFHHCQHRLEIS